MPVFLPKTLVNDYKLLYNRRMTEEEVKAYLEKMGNTPRNFNDEPYEVRKYLIETLERENKEMIRRLEELKK